MNTEQLLRRHAEEHPEEGWVDYSDFYQEMLEKYGAEDLWKVIPGFLAHSDHNPRCCGVILASTRRPETTEAQLMICPFMRDPHPLVRFTAMHQLLTLSRIEPVVEAMAYRIQQEEAGAEDLVPVVMAIRILLKANFAKYQHMLANVQTIFDGAENDSLVQDLASEAIEDYLSP